MQGVRAGGLIDIIVDQETGFLTENNDDMIDFSTRVKELGASADLRSHLGANGVSWAQVFTNPEKNYVKILEWCSVRVGVGKQQRQY